MEVSRFTPTNQAPASGLLAWNVPESERLMIGEIAGGTTLEMLENRGNWARVRREDGFTGWVDAAALQPLASTTKRGGAVACLIVIGILLLLALGIYLYIRGRLTLGQAPNTITGSGSAALTAVGNLVSR